MTAKKIKPVLAWSLLTHGKLSLWTTGERSQLRYLQETDPIYRSGKIVRVRITPVTKRKVKK